METSLFNYLLANLQRETPYSVIDHQLRAELHEDGRISFYIHPDGVDGETPSFYVDGNQLISK